MSSHPQNDNDNNLSPAEHKARYARLAEAVRQETVERAAAQARVKKHNDTKKYRKVWEEWGGGRSGRSRKSRRTNRQKRTRRHRSRRHR